MPRTKKAGQGDTKEAFEFEIGDKVSHYGTPGIVHAAYSCRAGNVYGVTLNKEHPREQGDERPASTVVTWDERLTLIEPVRNIEADMATSSEGTTCSENGSSSEEETSTPVKIKLRGPTLRPTDAPTDTLSSHAALKAIKSPREVKKAPRPRKRAKREATPEKPRPRPRSKRLGPPMPEGQHQDMWGYIAAQAEKDVNAQEEGH